MNTSSGSALIDTDTTFHHFCVIVRAVNNTFSAGRYFTGVYGFYFVKKTSTVGIGLSAGVDFTVSTNSSYGYPQITYTSGVGRNLTYNLNTLALYELHRRIYPVIRSKNQIVLTDDINFVAMSCTCTSSGYSIGQHVDTSISNPSTGQLLKYNGTAWVN